MSRTYHAHSNPALDYIDTNITLDDGQKIAIRTYPGSGGAYLISSLDRSGGSIQEAGIDMLESFLLALAANGLDISKPVFKKSIQEALKAFYNHYGDEDE
jgi:ABC-type transport system involved in cytochrome bd biosynthesis fused ATPase/permease subunit